MTDMHPASRFDRDTVATMLRVAGLQVEEDRLDVLADLLESAGEGASHIDVVAIGVPLMEALAVFDPSWPEGERGG